MKPHPEIIELDEADLESKLDQIEAALGVETAQPFRQLLRGYAFLVGVLREKKFSIRRLQKILFGAATERTSSVLSSSAESSGQVEETPSEQPATDQNTSSTADQENASGHSAGDHPAACRRGPNHGRIPASRYTGCAKVIVNHESLRPGDACPHCVNGTLYRQSAWSLVVRLKGQPPVTGDVFHRERLRCHDCGQVFTAALPAEAGPNKYDPSVASVVATLRYGEGFPWNRLQRTQRFAGVPLPASDQWERVRDAAERGPRAVYQHLCWLGAQGELLHYDDTTMCVLQLTGMIKRHEPLLEEDPDRRGVFTTGILSLAEGRPTIALYVTGPHHAGENLRTLLAARCPELPLPLGMCDGLSRNMPHDLRVIMANCLVHGRRKFVDVVVAFSAEVEHVLKCLKIVYQIDAEAKKQQLSPDQRLRLHQERSGPVMGELHRWLKTRFDERLVEPNSSLGKAISYMLKHWEELTRFLHVPGAPLDNNVCERALKMAIRHRNNSLFYRTPRGAAVGDLYMSLIYTCYLSGVSPVDYLTELQRNHERVRAAPGDWLPWNYRRQLVAAKSDAEVEVGRGPPGDAPLSTTCSPSN